MSAGEPPGDRRYQESPAAVEEEQRQAAAEQLPGVDEDDIETFVSGDDTRVRLSDSGQESAERALREQTAGQSDFVTEEDTFARVDPRSFDVETGIRDPEAVESRVREDAAADAEFVEPGDIDAEVSQRGVESVSISNREAVESRARSSVADEENLPEDEVEVDVGDLGVEDVSVTDRGRRISAARSFNEQIDVGSVSAGDIELDGDEAKLREDVRDDLENRAEEQVQEDAAEEFDDEVPEVEIGPDDVVIEDGEARLRENAQEEVTRVEAAEAFESGEAFDQDADIFTEEIRRTDDDGNLTTGRRSNPDFRPEDVFDDVDPEDIEVRENDDGELEAELSDELRREQGARFFEAEEGIEISRDDVEVDGEEIRLSEDVQRDLAFRQFEDRSNLPPIDDQTETRVLGDLDDRNLPESIRDFAREQAAERFEDRLSGIDGFDGELEPGDVRLTEDGAEIEFIPNERFGVEGTGVVEELAEEIDERLPNVDIEAEDLDQVHSVGPDQGVSAAALLDDDDTSLTLSLDPNNDSDLRSEIEQAGAQRLDDDLRTVNVRPDDVEIRDDGTVRLDNDARAQFDVRPEDIDISDDGAELSSGGRDALARRQLETIADDLENPDDVFFPFEQRASTQVGLALRDKLASGDVQDRDEVDVALREGADSNPDATVQTIENLDPKRAGELFDDVDAETIRQAQDEIDDAQRDDPSDRLETISDDPENFAEQANFAAVGVAEGRGLRRQARQLEDEIEEQAAESDDIEAGDIDANVDPVTGETSTELSDSGRRRLETEIADDISNDIDGSVGREAVDVALEGGSIEADLDQGRIEEVQLDAAREEVADELGVDEGDVEFDRVDGDLQPRLDDDVREQRFDDLRDEQVGEFRREAFEQFQDETPGINLRPSDIDLEENGDQIEASLTDRAEARIGPQFDVGDFDNGSSVDIDDDFGQQTATGFDAPDIDLEADSPGNNFSVLAPGEDFPSSFGDLRDTEFGRDEIFQTDLPTTDRGIRRAVSGGAQDMLNVDIGQDISRQLSVGATDRLADLGGVDSDGFDLDESIAADFDAEDSALAGTAAGAVAVPEPTSSIGGAVVLGGIALGGVGAAVANEISTPQREDIEIDRSELEVGSSTTDVSELEADISNPNVSELEPDGLQADIPELDAGAARTDIAEIDVGQTISEFDSTFDASTAVGGTIDTPAPGIDAPGGTIDTPAPGIERSTTDDIRNIRQPADQGPAVVDAGQIRGDSRSEVAEEDDFLTDFEETEPEIDDESTRLFETPGTRNSPLQPIGGVVGEPTSSRLLFDDQASRSQTVTGRSFEPEQVDRPAFDAQQDVGSLPNGNARPAADSLFDGDLLAGVDAAVGSGLDVAPQSAAASTAVSNPTVETELSTNAPTVNQTPTQFGNLTETLTEPSFSINTRRLRRPELPGFDVDETQADRSQTSTPGFGSDIIEFEVPGLDEIDDQLGRFDNV